MTAGPAAARPAARGRPPVALTVAGSDSGGGAGIAADLHTFAAHGVWGTCAVAAVTAQNTVGVQAVEVVAAAMVAAQMAAVAGDIGVGATKTGMLGDAAVVEAVAAAVVEWNLHPLVVDPVAVASSGSPLLSPDGVAALRRLLLPLADLVTPNLAEAAALARWSDPPADRVGMERVADEILALGPGAVLVTGGHLPGPDAADLLVRRGRSERRWLAGPRLVARHTHGTGCVLSAAITARLARGEEPVQAVEGAKAFVTAAIAAGVELGAGPGAVNPSGSSPP
ncbi:MAG TPA: bifunctional hydroxymethylpyrimidine kinase/phosphomethylpyrimidine kinase [Acidimicrobiia bacterium]|nr:bifunctional hydroxymethylpyrimidine kinase/phosphomethylpyrimidine kinase [Acidimicrobiia bacterium]